MVYLKIFKPDGSIYWQDAFKTALDAEKWIEKEKEKKYWDKGFTYTLEDKTSQEAADAAQKKAEAEAIQRTYAQAITDLKTARANADKKLSDVIIMVDLIADILTGEKLK